MAAGRTHRWFRKHPYRPTLEHLENRLTPAFNLGISNATTVGVDVDTVGSTTTFTAEANGANLNVADILTELNNGNNVVVTTGITGAEDGNITWDADADLDFNGIDAALSLTLQSTGSVGNISVAADIFDSNFAILDPDELRVIFDSSAANGTIQVDGNLLRINGLLVEAGQGNFNLASPGPVISRDSVDISALQTTLSADLTIGEISLINALVVRGGLTFTGGVRTINVQDGVAGGVIFENGFVSLESNVNIELDNLVAEGVLLDGAGLDIGANTLTITDSAILHEFIVTFGSTISGTGTIISPSMLVIDDAAIHPGGDEVGALTIMGNVIFGDDAVLKVDIGTTSDLLIVTGDVLIDSEAKLRGRGVLPNATPVTLLEADGTLTGTFEDTTGGAFVLGTDAVTAAYAAAAPGSLTVTQAAAGPKRVEVVTAEGDIAVIRLQGGGPAQLVVRDTDNDGDIDFIVVRKSSKKNYLTITVTPNGGSGTVFVKDVLINGRIDRIIGQTTVLDDGLLEVTGNVRKIAVQFIAGQSVVIGGTSSQVTNLQAMVIDESFIDSNSRIGTLKANGFFATSLFAPTLNNLQVRRSSQFMLAGDIEDSLFVITENRGKKRNGLATVQVDGTVENTFFSVKDGNVNKFQVGRFLDSALFVGYDPPLSEDFSELGEFSATNYVIRTFRTTVVPNSIVTDVFAGSQVVAARLGTVRLSGVTLDNSGTPFGLRVKAGVSKNVGSVRIANTAPFIAGQDYLPTATGEVDPSVGGLGAQGDFRFFV